MERIDAAREFLETLWGDVEKKHRLCIMTLPKKGLGASHYHFQDIESAAAYVSKSDLNTYAAVSLQNQTVKGDRASSTESAGIPGMWADIDYVSEGAHKSSSIAGRKPLPPDEEAAMLLIDALPIKPTIIVHSGHGLQPWWLFKEPLIFETDAERTAAELVSAKWQALVAQIADSQGYSCDKTSDLARVMRVPGSYNWKTDLRKEVRIVKRDGPRIDEITDLEEILQNFDGNDDTAASVTLSETGAKSVEHFTRIISGVDEGSRNVDLTSLAGLLVFHLIDPTDSKIVSVVSQLLHKVNDDYSTPLPDKEVTKLFRSALSAERIRRNGLYEAESFDKQYKEIMRNNGDINEMVEQVRDQLGFRFERVVKIGREDSDYVFYLTTGEDIKVGNMLIQVKMRQQIRDATKGETIINQFTKKQWDDIGGRIAIIAEEQRVDDEEIIIKSDVTIENYLQDVGCYREEEWKEALPDSQPFIRREFLHVNLTNIESFLQQKRHKQKGQREVAMFLRMTGWEPTSISFRVHGEDTVSKRYWKKSVQDVKFQYLTRGSAFNLTTPTDEVTTGDVSTEEITEEAGSQPGSP